MAAFWAAHVAHRETPKKTVATLPSRASVGSRTDHAPRAGLSITTDRDLGYCPEPTKTYALRVSVQDLVVRRMNNVAFYLRSAPGHAGCRLHIA